MTKTRKILITGGVRSGKSRLALTLAKEFTQPRIFIATAQAFDPEMKQRIERHQKERNSDFTTLEEPLYLSKVIDNLLPNSIAIIDCLTFWMNNLLYHFKNDETQIMDQIDLFIHSLKKSSANIIIVSNETGWGIIPPNEISRQFIERTGFVNQTIAAVCDEVILTVAGLPHWMKGKEHGKLSR